MPDEKAVSVDVEKVSVEKLVLPPAAKPSLVQNLLSLTPLLSVLITGVALVVSSGVQVYQNRTDAALKVDADWRSALEKIDMEGKSAAISALEMQSFLESEKHSEQARSLAAAAIPNIDDKYEFDAAYFVVVHQTQDRNQGDLVSIARSLTNQVGELYDAWKQAHPETASTPGHAEEDFVVDPQPFFDEKTESPALKAALAKTWELDSAINGLSLIWNQRPHLDRLKPGSMDLSGLIFLNNNFESVDFSQAPLDNARFVGGCAVNTNKLPPTARVLCHQSEAAGRHAGNSLTSDNRGVHAAL